MGLGSKSIRENNIIGLIKREISVETLKYLMGYTDISVTCIVWHTMLEMIRGLI